MHNTRSRLYHWTPCGVGTPVIETSTSFTERVSIAHNLVVRDLLVFEVVPRLQQSSNTYSNGRKDTIQLTSQWWKNCSVALNGLANSASDWSSALQYLTGRTELRYLTMLTYREMLSCRRLLRRTRSWCPHCYEEARTKGEVVYDPLLWAIEVVEICPYHQCRLHLQCPYSGCNSLQWLLAPRSRPGYCQFCNRWLGRADPPVLETENLEAKLATCTAVGELLAIAPTLAEPPKRELIGQTLVTYVDKSLDGNVAELARRLDVHHTTARALVLGTQIPQLPTFLKLCTLVGLSPANLVHGSEPANRSDHIPVYNIPDEPRSGRQEYRKFDEVTIGKRLVEELFSKDTPQSMKDVADEVGYDQSHIRQHFRNLCRAVSHNYMNHKHDQKRERIRRDCNLVQQTTITLHSQGIYPSIHQLSKYLNGAILKEPEVYAMWINTMRSLGYTLA